MAAKIDVTGDPAGLVESRVSFETCWTLKDLTYRRILLVIGDK